MKKLFAFVLALGCGMLAFADFYVEVNGNTYYAADETGAVDFQGRTQYAALCVALQAGDVLKCYDASNKVSWAIMANDQGATWGAPGFTATANGLTCSIAGNYNIYIKLKFEDDIWYVETAGACTPVSPVDPSEGGGGGGGGEYATAAPANCPDVMLQGFYWNSYQKQTDSTSIFGRTKWIDLKPQAAEMGQWFDLVWLPPCTKSSGGLGYHPVQYSNLDSDLGTQRNLLAIIDSLHHNGCRVVADIVVNHSDGSSWCSFYKQNFGNYGTFQPTAAWICQTDEMNISGSGVSPECLGKATGAVDDGYDGEANYTASRDWDHQNPEVRNMIKAYLKWLRYEVGFDGFRYDYCKGFHMSHVNEYNTEAKPYFSVLEYWDGNVNTLQSRLNDAGWNTLTFDFATYYTALKGGIAQGYYQNCRGAGLPGAGKARYACTYVDSHDTFQRYPTTDVADRGDGRSVELFPDIVLACNAYILSMPGVPCVFYPHWVSFKPQIKAMINARYKTGVHSESAVSDETGNGYYKATISGTNGSIRLLLGPNSGWNTTPSGYTLAAKGTNWGVYYQTISARTDKDQNRQPIGTAVEEVKDEMPKAEMANKVMIDGQLFIIAHDKMYDVMGNVR